MVTYHDLLMTSPTCPDYNSLDLGITIVTCLYDLGTREESVSLVFSWRVHFISIRGGDGSLCHWNTLTCSNCKNVTKISHNQYKHSPVLFCMFFFVTKFNFRVLLVAHFLSLPHSQYTWLI